MLPPETPIAEGLLQLSACILNQAQPRCVALCCSADSVCGRINELRSPATLRALSLFWGWQIEICVHTALGPRWERLQQATELTTGIQNRHNEANITLSVCAALVDSHVRSSMALAKSRLNPPRGSSPNGHFIAVYTRTQIPGTPRARVPGFSSRPQDPACSVFA